MDGQGRERLERLDVGSVVRTVFLLSVFVAFFTGVLAFGAWHALAALDLVRGVEELVGELAGGVFRIDRSNFAGAFVGLEGLLVVTATAFAGIGASVYNQAAEIVGGVEFDAEDSIRKRDRPLARAFRKTTPGERPAVASVRQVASPEHAATPSPQSDPAAEAAATLCTASRLVMMIIKNGHLELSTCEIDSLVPLASSRTTDEAEGRVVCLASVADPGGAVAFSETGHVRSLAETGRIDGQAGITSRQRPGRARSTTPIAVLDRAEVGRSPHLLFVTARGRVKRTPAPDCMAAAATGRRALKVGPGDRLVAVVPTTGSDEIVVATRRGLALRFRELDVTVSNAATAPVRGLRVDIRDEVVSASRIAEGTVVDLLTVTERGFAKRTSVEDFRVQRRGGRGVRAAVLTEDCGQLVAALAVAASDDVLLGSDRSTLTRIPATSIRRQSRTSTGSCVAPFGPAERVTVAAAVSNR